MVESAACPGNDEGFMFLCASASAQTRPCWWAKAHGPSVIHQRLPDYPKAESFHSTGAGAAGRGRTFCHRLTPGRVWAKRQGIGWICERISTDSSKVEGIKRTEMH